MRSLTVWVDSPVVDGREMMMVMTERDEIKGLPTMESIRDGILLGRVEEAIELYITSLIMQGETQ